jgi:tetratricopeptide (TPR) repeat protein
MRTGRSRQHRIVAPAALAACLAAGSCGSPGSAGPATASEELGTVHFGVVCDGVPEGAFDRAVALLHHMTYPQARAAFEEIAARSQGCAMAHWGIATTLFQPLWPTRPSEADLERGAAELRRAREIGVATPRDSLFLAMAEAFFEPGAGEYWSRIANWAVAAQRLYEVYPRDDDAAAFYALAQLATAPAAGGTQHHERAAEVLAAILAANPTHPGAIHYTVHANDATGRERFSPEVIARYLEIAPRNPHALHMPTHIFVRLGAWPEVIEWNDSAAAAALEHPAGAQGEWVWDEFPHAIEYQVYAYLQRGDDAAARQALDRLVNTPNLEPSFKTAFHLSSIPARYALERGAWSEAAALPPRPSPALAWDRFPWPEAVTWYARGMGAARMDDTQSASAAEAKLVALREAAGRAGEELFTRQIEILRMQVAAWLAHASGRDDEAVALLREAVALEAATPKHAVTPAPTLPAAESLGDLLLALGRTGEALEAYRGALAATPGRFNAIAGAARAALQLADTATAAGYYEQLRGQAAEHSPRPALGEGVALLKARARS